MKIFSIKKVVTLLLIALLAMSIFSCVSFAYKGTNGVYSDGEHQALLGSSDDDRYITFTLYAGEDAYFVSGDEHVDSISSIQFRGDVFEEDRVPVSTLSDSYNFAGWVTNSGDAYDPMKINVVPGMTNTGMIQSTTLYAAWDNRCTVMYHIDESKGYVRTDMGIGVEVPEYYDKHDSFINFEPEVVNENFEFDGWYDSNDNKYTTAVEITDRYIDVFARFKFSSDGVEKMNLDTEYALSTGMGEKYLQFVPSETDMYKLSSEIINPTEDDIMSITIMDEYGTILKANSGVQIEDGMYFVAMELEEGVSYFFDIHEMSGYYVQYNAIITKEESTIVSFHLGEQAYYDGDENKHDKDVHIMIGDDLARFFPSDFELVDWKISVFAGWTTEEGGTSKEDEIIVEGPMDLYAVYEEHEGILVLDPQEDKGGYFSFNKEEDGCVHLVYDSFRPFDPFPDPKNKNPKVKYAGWSVNPDATEPDADIIEGVTSLGEIDFITPNTLYAVYTDRVLETYDANGGYFMDNPAITYFYSTKGVGHIFYGMRLMNDDPSLSPIGWTDQDGEEIPYEIEGYPYYHLKGDTTYTARWGYTITLVGNGGTFTANSSMAQVKMDKDGVFDLGEYSFLEDMIYWDDEGARKFVGWATDPDATEPDIIPGETVISDIVDPNFRATYIYAIWEDDEYYYESGDHIWTKGSEDGLTFIVHRGAKNIETSTMYKALEIDGERITEGAHVDGSDLELTLYPELLETYDSGDHTITIYFKPDSDNYRFEDEKYYIPVSTTFTIVEEAEKDTEGESGDKSGDQSGDQDFSGDIYTVTFNSNKGSEVEAQEVKEGETAVKPADPTRKGYNFVAWYSDSKLKTKFDFKTPITEDIIVYAKWKSTGGGGASSGSKEEKETAKEEIKPSGDNKPTENIPVSSDTSKPADKFTDVKSEDWFYENVNFVVENGLFNGTSETTFSPNDNLTRGMLVTVLYRLAGATDADISTFDDVDKDMYYSAPIAWASKNGYVNGMGDNKFYPDKPITRQDLVTIVYRYIKAQGKGFTGMWSFNLEFNDKGEIAEYAFEPVCFMTMNKIVNGKDGNVFDPSGLATRAETAKIIQLVADLLK